MQIGVPQERSSSEHRVAATPHTIERFNKLGFDVVIEKGAGNKAGFQDYEYLEAGAKIVENLEELHDQANIIIRIQAPSPDEAKYFKKRQLGISYANGDQHKQALEIIAANGASYIAMNSIPRLSRAQKMDALSSMANVAGYRAVLEAAEQYGRFLNGQMTAAGKVDPARVLIIGAGVAGLAAIATAKSMGAIVQAFDTRTSTEDQIKSLGAEPLFVEIEEDGSTDSGYSKVMSQAFIDAEMDLFRSLAPNVDIVITTALIPNRPAPKLWLKDMVEMMKPGSVVVDLAFEQGGNCELTQPGKVIVTERGVKIVGTVDQMPMQSSQLYSSNIAHLLHDMGGAKNFKIDPNDKVILGSLIVSRGKVNWPLPRIAVAAAAPPKQEKPIIKIAPHNGNGEKKKKINYTLGAIILGCLFILIVGQYAPTKFMNHLTVFLLSIFVGWQVIWNVSHSLHTPLMSVTNAISGIILLGGILHVGAEFDLKTILAIIAVLIASINIVGGFLVTHKMLRMFQKEKKV